MDLAPLLVIVALLAGATVIGLRVRHRDGRLRPAAAGERILEVPLGERGTLLQLSSAACASCPGTARLLGTIAERRPGIRHVELDVDEHPELVARLRVLQTPTTLILDADGAVRSRIGGPARPDAVEDAIERLDAP
ncbi:TlpA family protein disulfide reductase [Homoserinibacter sp. YIM 151385]|uniref:TlpA family protein disulfide reductase n=1 Tax=Homoserinibacter sp. YIM 151385 TaxID=2985506 RepID=UPI0022F14428|nr:thioredoxin family protein [Homoserinibacter sp. YIM 151385]WBU38907.1 thioredoxin family protein [Homoserinibacter sp. YIM 151385]